MIFGRRGRSFVEMDEAELLESVGRYVKHIEISKTTDTCKCITEIHPDDANIEKGKARRMRVIEMALDCPVHTREGFLLGYFEFMKRGKHRL